METISTANLRATTLNGALSVQSQLAQVQTEESTGLVAQSFGEMGGAATQSTLNLQNEISQAQTWSSEAQTAGDRSQAAYSAIGSIITTMNSLDSNIASGMTNINSSDLSLTASALQQQLVQQINVQSGGRYVFSGTDTTTAPVSLTNYPALNTTTTPASYDQSTADTSYYQGSNQTLSVRVGSEQTIDYGVTAANPAIEQAMRAMEAVVQATKASPVDQTMLKQALTTCTSAIASLGALQESVSDTANQLTSAQESQTTYATYLENSLSNVKDANTAAVAAAVTQYQNQLQASFMAVASITKLSLTTYL